MTGFCSSWRTRFAPGVVGGEGGTPAVVLVLRYPVHESLRYPWAADEDEEEAIEEVAHHHWAAMTIAWTMFDRNNRSPGRGVAGSVGWVILIGMNTFL